MNRILFAAARGARIEALSDGHWYGVGGIVIPKDLRTLRIHPDDLALEYGPVSSALREAAAGNSWEYLNGNHQMAIAALRHEAWYWDEADPLHSSLFLLLMAESLADEGL